MLGVMLCVVSYAGWKSQSSSTQNTRNASLVGVVSTRVPIAHRDVDDTTGASQASIPTLLQLANAMLLNMRDNIHDYRAVLVKRERIQGKLADEARMEIKVRNRPTENQHTTTQLGLAAYLKFHEPQSARGREVIWVENKYENKIIAHESGFLNLLRVSLDPHGSMAMMGNKYPITEIGLMRLIEKLIEKCNRVDDLSQWKVEIVEDQIVGDRKCRMVQVTQPKSVPGADFYIAQVFIDVDRQVPLRYAAFMWPQSAVEPAQLEEEYTYLDLELNVGLTDEDFDPDNAAYNYP